MLDPHQREINYLRISVTDRCNLRCTYCMPEGGVPLTDHKNILKLEEIVTLVKAAVKVGIKKVRLTGGEPLVREGIVQLVEDITALPEIDDIALTTNGILLPKFGQQLKAAGLKRVNISLDTLKAERFHQITRLGKLEDAWQGIEEALKQGFHPIKLNTIIMDGFNDDEILDFAKLTMDYPLHLRFIELMPIGESNAWASKKRITTAEIKDRLYQIGKLKPVKKLVGGGPAKYYQLPGAQGTIGFINAISSHFCSECNRLRLTSEGKLRLCLHSPQEMDLKTPLRQGASLDELAGIIAEAVSQKPFRHSMVDQGWVDDKRNMSQIGG